MQVKIVMTDKKQHLCRTLKRTVKEFLADIRDNIFIKDEEKEDMLMVDFFFEKLSDVDLMSYVIKHILPHKKMIIAKDENFFIEERNNIFAGISKEKVEHFAIMCKTPYHEGGLSEHNKGVLWEYFETILAIAELYKKSE